MRHVFGALVVLAGCALCSSAHAQFGGGGGFGGGAMGGGQFGGGGIVGSSPTDAGSITNRIGRYLNGDEVANILTPGEYSEWPQTLKAGQVLFADARSDAFDPAIEVVDAKGAVVASNDDRYPGDQRPLLLWRCGQDGSYGLRVRCFHNKAGGQFFLRLNVYECVDVNSQTMTERSLGGPGRFLLRVPMRAGQVKQVVTECPDQRRYWDPNLLDVISPTGLPDAQLNRPIAGAVPDAIVAPVDGDYYVLEALEDEGNKLVRVGTRDIVPAQPAKQGDAVAATLKAGVPSLVSLAVKAGDMLVATAPDLSLQAPLVLAEEPDFAAYSLQKAESNPFFPRARDRDANKGAAYTVLPGRARDSRVLVFVARRDARLWLAASGTGAKGAQYVVAIRPAARALAEGKRSDGKLTIGSYDYWAFDASVGDVMRFRSGSSTFAERISVRDPDLGDVTNAVSAPDQADVDWGLIARKRGRYLVVVSALGDGGGGAYTIERHVFPARQFAKGTAAKGDLADGQTQVWKFTARPEGPLLVRWTSTGQLAASVCDENGEEASLPLTRVDKASQYGVLAVEKPTTYLIVLSAAGAKASYTIELSDIPGYVRAK